jgi:hypothetical protein
MANVITQTWRRELARAAREPVTAGL